MKAVLHKTFSWVMACLLLASTTSWTVGKHYCMGHLVDISLFAHADDCGMDMSEGAPSDGEDESSCCDDELMVVQGQDNLTHTFNDLDVDQQLFLVAYAHYYINLFDVQEQRPVPHEQYSPPLLVKDIQLLDEVFLI